MNKNISIWRGSNTPPTLNHLWIDETNNVKININNEWVSLLEIISNTILDDYINNIENNVISKAIIEGIAKIVADAPEDLDTLKEVADYIASDKTKAAEIETAISNLKKADTQLTNSINANATNIAKNTSDITTNTEALAKQAKELNTKAPKNGYAPDLKVDFAKELVGRGVAEPQEIGTIRPTGLISIGDGNATIERIKGESVVWNQLEPNYDLSNNALSVSCKNATTINGIVSIEGVTSYTAYIYASRDKIKIYQGHKYLLSVEVISAEYVQNQMAVYDLTNKNTLIVGVQTWIRSDKWEKISKITTATTNGIGSFLIYPAYNSAIFDTLTDWQGRNFIVHDLTLMFGAGNEPTTIEEFEARKPLGVTNEYSAGEIISYDGDILKSVGFNAYNGTYAKVIGGEEYHAVGTTNIGFAKDLGGETTEITLDSNGRFTPSEDGYVYAEGTDIVIHLTHSYTPEHTTKYEEDTLTLPDVKAIKDKDGNQLFPYGLLSVGNAYDEITATKAVKKFVCFALDDIEDWVLYGINEHGIANFYVSYDGLSQYNKYSKSDMFTIQDTLFSVTETEGYYLTENRLYIRISTNKVSTVEQFKAWLNKNPSKIIVRLSNPIEVDLPEPLNMTYEAWDFGTEELVAEGKTTPLNADIVYQFNAVDRIRENTAKNQALGTELAELKAQLTQLTQVTNDEKNNV